MIFLQEYLKSALRNDIL